MTVMVRAKETVVKAIQVAAYQGQTLSLKARAFLKDRGPRAQEYVLGNENSPTRFTMEDMALQGSTPGLFFFWPRWLVATPWTRKILTALETGFFGALLIYLTFHDTFASTQFLYLLFSYVLHIYSFSPFSIFPIYNIRPCGIVPLLHPIFPFSRQYS